MKGGATDTASPPTRSVDVVRLSAQAHSAYAEKKMDVVLDLSSRLLEADPDNVVGLKLTARILTQRGEIDLAEPIWRRLYVTGPDKIEPALSLARIGYSRSDWDAMAEFADLAVRESGGRADALRLAITARMKAKRADELPEMLIRFRDAAPDQFMALFKTLGTPELAQAQASVLVRLGARAPGDPALDTVVARMPNVLGGRGAARTVAKGRRRPGSLSTGDVEPRPELSRSDRRIERAQVGSG